MSWEDFLAFLRLDLQDNSASPRWTDKLLWIYTCDAIRDYSIWFPLEQEVTISNVNGYYILPTDFVEEITVECPLRTYLKKRQEFPGTTEFTIDDPRYYRVSIGKIKLDSDTTESIKLTYLAVHTVPTSESEIDAGTGVETFTIQDDFVFTVPDRDLELLRIYVIARVNQQMRGKTARLDRFKQGSGNRDDNPIIPEVDNLLEEYHIKIAERIRGATIKLYLVGDRHGN